MFRVTPKEDFSNFRAGVSYKVLSSNPIFVNSQLKFLVYDDTKDIVLMPAEKFKYIEETSSSPSAGLTPQQKAAITRQKNKANPAKD